MDYEDRYQQAKNLEYDCLIFDLDDTLYPLASGLAAQCRKNIEEYMVEKLGIKEDKVSDLSYFLYKNYGTTMAGLRAIGFDFDYDEFHSFVHGRLPYEKLKPDPVLRNLILSLPLRKVIFTNADKIHAARVLSILGLEDCFEGIICFETLNPTHKNTVSDDEGDTDGGDNKSTNPSISPFDILKHLSQSDVGSESEFPKTLIVCKPSEVAIERALALANVSNPQRAIFFDDSIRNIQSGKNVGLRTVLVGTSQRVKGADYSLESIHNIREALPELWEAKEIVTYPDNVAIETSVVA